MREVDEQHKARQQFSRQSQKIRRWQILILPLLAALILPLAGFLWFAFTPPAQEARPPLSPASAAPALTVRAAGEIMLAGTMADKLTAHGVEFPFRNISEFLSAADFSYAALTTALADTGSPLPGKPVALRAEISAIESLVLSGLDAAALASPHMMDYDAPALTQTTQLLGGAGIGFMGAGENIAAAAKPYTLSQNGLRAAFLNFCENADVFYSYQYPRSMAATENQAGVANLDETAALAAIAEARKNHDVVVLSLYWGEEFSYLPRESQRQLAHRLIDGGADVIVGYGTHCLQGAELYSNGLIIYSLGNMVYAQTDSRQAREAAILELELTKLGWQSALLHPLLLSSEGQPALAIGQDAAEIRERLRSISSGFGATFTVVGNALRVSK